VTTASVVLTLTHFLKPASLKFGQQLTTFEPSSAALLQTQDLSHQSFWHLHLLIVINPPQELAGVSLTSTCTAEIGAETIEEVSRFTVVKRSKSCAFHFAALSLQPRSPYLAPSILPPLFPFLLPLQRLILRGG
jgi:hypothetical protein